MKKKIRRISSLLAAGAILTSAFSVTSFAATGSEASADSSIVTLLEEDFSNFQQGDNWCDRTQMWRVEQWNNDAFGTDANSWASIADTVGSGAMTKALKLSNGTTDGIRGGRSWTSDKYVMPGETLTFEVDIYADATKSNPRLGFGLVSEYGAAAPDDYGWSNNLFVVWDGYIYLTSTQKKISYDFIQASKIEFKNGEVNHIRVDYKINDDMSNIADTETITVTNSNGTKQYTGNVNRRVSTEDTKLTSAAGISYFKRGDNSDVYIDNIKVYQEKTYQNGNYTLIKDNFNSLNNGSNWGDNNRVDSWRIEGGKNGWNGDLGTDELSIVGDFGGKTNVLKLANTTVDSNSAPMVRGGRGWSSESAEFIQPGETVSIEFDIYAENNSKFMLGIVGGNRSSSCEEDAGNGALFYVKNDGTNGVYCARSQFRDDSNVEQYSGVNFARNEFNHVKIDYTLNTDVSMGTNDTVSITVENSTYGTQTATYNPRLRYDYADKTDDKPITSIRGISFFKAEAASTVYLDNVEVYRSGVTLPATTVDTSKAYTDGNSSVSVTFSEPMNEASLANVMVIADAKKAASVMPLTTTKSLSADKKTYTLTGNFVEGTTYQLVIPASVKTENGIKLTEGEIHNFTATTRPTTVALTNEYNNGNIVKVNIAASSADVNKTVYAIIAKYAADGSLDKVEISNSTTLTADTTPVTFNLGGNTDDSALRTGWKAFVWTTDKYTPLCTPATN